MGSGGGPGDATPNWITLTWPLEFVAMLKWQWEEVAIPYWRDLVGFAEDRGIREICIENHGSSLVCNAATMLRLRDATGTTVGANLDPSHMFWMGGDPVAAVRALDEVILNVHAMDTRIDPPSAGPNTTIETKSFDRPAERSWNFVTLGSGHDEAWWRRFIVELREAGYADVLSIEHEDAAIDPVRGVEDSVALLHRLI